MNRWKGKTVEEIDMVEMMGILNKGIRTMDDLSQEFRNHVNIKETVKTVRNEVNRWVDIYKVLEKLKNPAFKPNYWDELLEEMYPDPNVRPAQTKIILKNLLEEKLMHYESKINSLFQRAEYEFKIEREIREVERNLQNVPIDIELYEQRETRPFYVIKNMKELLPKLNGNISLL